MLTKLEKENKLLGKCLRWKDELIFWRMYDFLYHKGMEFPSQYQEFSILYACTNRYAKTFSVRQIRSRRSAGYGRILYSPIGNSCWPEAGIAEKVAHVHEIHEQYGRREARRKAGFGLWGKGE